MSERAPYSRIYWSIIPPGDSKFATVFDDNDHLATWVRLLLAADQAWPAPANIPASVRRKSLTELVRVGLVDLQPGGRYRIHGLEAERVRRKVAATSRGPLGHHSVPERDPNGFAMQGLRRDETRRDETRLDSSGTSPRVTPRLAAVEPVR